MGKRHGQQAAHLIESYRKWIDKLTVKSRALLPLNAMRFLPFKRAGGRQSYRWSEPGSRK